jgi:hypothetical protein
MMSRAQTRVRPPQISESASQQVGELASWRVGDEKTRCVNEKSKSRNQKLHKSKKPEL